MKYRIFTQELDSIQRVINKFHKTRLTYHVLVDPDDLAHLLDVCLLATGRKRRYDVSM